MTKFFRAIRKEASPWWNRKLAEDRFRRLVKFIARKGPPCAPVVYDVGARWGISPPYDRLASVPGFQSVGFEPDPEEAKKLVEQKAFTHVCNVALGKKRERRSLGIAQNPGGSSFFPPNMTEYARHTDCKGLETVRKIEVDVVPLKEVISDFSLRLPDFIKIDCEGAEQEIFEGLGENPKNVCGITFEARFMEIYRGGTTLGRMTELLFQQGFICLRMDPVGSFWGSLMMFDVVMVRHPESIRDRRQFLLCLLFCLLHGNWQYAHRTAVLRADDFGCGELKGMLKR